jgi:hypothetical protein
MMSAVFSLHPGVFPKVLLYPYTSADPDPAPAAAAAFPPPAPAPLNLILPPPCVGLALPRVSGWLQGPYWLRSIECVSTAKL